MKYLIIVIMLLTIACKNESNEKTSIEQLTDRSITEEMKCENCGMNLQKYISTNHIIKMNNNDLHNYCSIHCIADVWNKEENKVEKVLALDVDSRKFVDAEKAYYVIGSKLRGTMTKVSKFSFEKLGKAEKFSKQYQGKEIVNYETAFKMSKEEIFVKHKMNK